MVAFRGFMISSLVLGVHSSPDTVHTVAASSLYPSETNTHSNRNISPLRNIWGRARSDLSSKSESFLTNIHKQSRIKVSQALQNLSHSSPLLNVQCSASNLPFDTRGGSTAVKKKRQNNSGFYYGIRDDVFFPKKEEEEANLKSSPSQVNKRPTSPSYSSPRLSQRERDSDIPSSRTLSDVMGETLLELREMREDIYALREEMQYMKEEFKRQKELATGGSYAMDDDDVVFEDAPESYQYPTHKEGHKQSYMERVSRKTEFEHIGREVEKWAHSLLFEENAEDHGWKEVKCNKMVRKKFNPHGQTSCYLKWMKDSRGKHGNNEDDEEYPCVKVFTTINAPMEDVCEYLSNEHHMAEYNDLVVAHRDLEDITPHSKICWSQCPQILFIKPRDFVTYCHHRWRRDGTQIVVSQACDHEDAPANNKESDDKACRAYSLRGANFIQRDPNDPNKTRMAILAHANCGGGVPQWAMKTAVNAVAPIEPFKLFHRIDEKVNAYSSTRQPNRSRADFVNANGRTRQPAGLSQLGYACFWPKGGGRVGPVEPVSVVNESSDMNSLESIVPSES